MPKYSVYGIMTASVFLGDYEAENEEAAKELAWADPDTDLSPSLCHQCAHEIDLGEVYDMQVEEAP